MMIETILICLWITYIIGVLILMIRPPTSKKIQIGIEEVIFNYKRSYLLKICLLIFIPLVWSTVIYLKGI